MGANMFKKGSFALAVVAALLISAPAFASDIVYPGGGTLAQIVDGGGTNTIITLVNLDVVAVPYTLSFFADTAGPSGATPLILTTTAGTSAAISGVLPVGGSTIIQTNGGGSSVTEGYAVLVANSPSCYGYGERGYTGYCQVAGSVVFSIPLLSGVIASASCPLDTGYTGGYGDSIIVLPFDESGDAASALTGIAIANSPLDAPNQPSMISETAYVQVAFYDQNGNQIPTPVGQVDTIILPSGAHTSFLLDQQYPQIIGQKGTVVFTGTDASNYLYLIKVLGLRATATTFTSIIPIVPCDFTYSTTSGGYCQN